MAGFRGIGDAATEVIKDQNQLGMEAARLSETARQFDVSAADREKARIEESRQFDAVRGDRAKQQAAGFYEEQRQFDTGMAQRQAAMGEQTRQFDVSRSDQQAQQERAFTLDDFKAGLDAITTDAELKSKDADTQMRMAQLGQYFAATKDEENRRKNREVMTKGAFGSLALSSIMNGGVMPSSAIEIANRELGDKDNQIVGGGTDPQSGVTFFSIRGKDGQVTQKKMAPEVQYMLLQEAHGDKVADLFAANYSRNATVTAAIERERIKKSASKYPKFDAAAYKALSDAALELGTATDPESVKELARVKLAMSNMTKSLLPDGVQTETNEQPTSEPAAYSYERARLTEIAKKTKRPEEQQAYVEAGMKRFMAANPVKSEQAASAFKDGDVKTIGGVKYTRTNGKWISE